MHVAAAVVHLGEVERQGVVDVHGDGVDVGVKAVGGADRDGVITGFFEIDDHVTIQEVVAGCSGFIGGHGDEGLIDRVVNIGHAVLQVDHHLRASLDGDGFEVRHVQSWGVVDGVDTQGDGLVRRLLAIAGSQRQDRLTVDVVVHRLKVEHRAAQAGSEHVGVGVVNDGQGQVAHLGGVTGIVGVGERIDEAETSTATFVHRLNWQTGPTWLTVLNHVKQKCTVG